MKKTMIIFIVLYLSVIICHAGETAFITAEEAFKSEDYQGALSIYKELLEQGVKSKELYYNIACTYYRLERIGLSRAYFKIASFYSPLNSDIRHNLDVLRNRVNFKDRFADAGEGFLYTPFNRIVRARTFNRWSQVFFSIFGILLVFLSVTFLREGLIRPRQRNFLLFMLFLIILAVFPFFRASYHLYHNTDIAVIINEASPLRNGPHHDMPVIAMLNEGLLLRVMEERNGYIRVLLPDKAVGWINEEDIFAIRSMKDF